MNLRELELLHSLMSLGTVSDAARMLHMSQPNASKLLKKIEARFGFELFERSNGRLSPTGEARMLFDQLESTLMSLKRLQGMTEDIRDMARGTIVIGGLPLLSHRWLPDLLADFLARHPGIDLSLQTRSSRKLIDMVADRQLDLAVGMLQQDDPLVECVQLASVGFVVAMPRSHSLAARQQIGIDDLDGQDFVSLSVLDHAREQIEKVFVPAGVCPRVRCECSLPLVALRMVERGVGVALVDVITASENPKDSLVYRPLAPLVNMTIWLMRPKMRPRSRLVDQVVEMIRVRAAAEAWGDSIQPDALFIDGFLST